MQHIQPDLNIEAKYSNNIIAGVDETGRGSLAGPIVATAVIIDQSNIIPGIKDSKKLSIHTRQKLYNQITSLYLHSTYVVQATEIDKINILEANKKACINAVYRLDITPDVVLVDGNMKFDNNAFISIINGDNLSLSIAAASIVAKVIRDKIMQTLDKEYPEYLWFKNYGYGTKEHLNAIDKYGLSPYHRKSFKCKNLISKEIAN